MTHDFPPPRLSVASNPLPFSGGRGGGVPPEESRRHRRLLWFVERLARELGEARGHGALDGAAIMALCDLGVAAGLSEEEATGEAVRGVALGARLRRLAYFNDEVVL